MTELEIQDILLGMKLNDRIISSLDSLRVNFDFIEIWNKRSVAIRDLSPSLIYYPNKELIAYYEAFAHPENVINNNGVLVLHCVDKDIELTMNIEDKLLSKYSLIERIQILALHKLAGVSLTEVVSDAVVDAIPMNANEIILDNGQSLSCVESKKECGPLSHKPIFVLETSKKKSKVGDYYLEPGQMTYGVFCDGDLVDVVAPYATNSSFHLEYSLIDNKITLVVFDNATNNQVAKYGNAHYYALLGETDFIVINGLIVSCFNNEDHNNRLRQTIVKAKSPEIVKVNDGVLQVVYKDNTKEIIQL